MSTVDVNCYLIVGAKLNPSGTYVMNKPSIKVSKLKPKTESHEVAINLNLELPIGLFRRPQIIANVSIPDNSAPVEISAEVQDNIAAALRQSTGMDVRLIFEAPEQQ